MDEPRPTTGYVHEAYADNAAFKTHMENLVPILERHGGIFFDLSELHIWGPLSDEVKASVDTAFPEAATLHRYTLSTL